MKYHKPYQKRILALCLLAPSIAGCSAASDLKDAEWFSRPGRLFIRNISIEQPPLNPDKPVLAEDLVSADGACPGMMAPENAAMAASAPGSKVSPGPAPSPMAGNPSDANASAEARAPSTTGTVALGHTECDVVRGIGAPESVKIANNERGDRETIVTYLQGQRAGIYTFTAGRLTSVERAPEQPAPPKTAAKAAKPKKKQATTAPTGSG